mmetsp:Transcript_69272/g.207854  ORF Transcript_69272/g.207854 Transcript_69272/m.207854 type:complete len:337 (+) Transcript_69272:864-1874(+)
MSPEMYLDRPYNTKSDMWSLGCVLYELCEQKAPFVASSAAQLMRQICAATFAPVRHADPDGALGRLLGLLLVTAPEVRASASALLETGDLLEAAVRWLQPGCDEPLMSGASVRLETAGEPASTDCAVGDALRALHGFGRQPAELASTAPRARGPDGNTESHSGGLSCTIGCSVRQQEIRSLKALGSGLECYELGETLRGAARVVLSIAEHRDLSADGVALESTNTLSKAGGGASAGSPPQAMGGSSQGVGVLRQQCLGALGAEAFEAARKLLADDEELFGALGDSLGSLVGSMPDCAAFARRIEAEELLGERNAKFIPLIEELIRLERSSIAPEVD